MLADDSNASKGCLPHLQLPAFGFKAFVPKDDYVDPSPVITKFVPGHDYRIPSTPTLPIELHFSAPMNCQQVANSLYITSTTSENKTVTLDGQNIDCMNVTDPGQSSSSLAGAANTAWIFSATLIDVSDGIHQISINNVSSAANDHVTTNSHDHFLLRIGQTDNPMVFASANYSSNVLYRDETNNLSVSHKAAGADMFRYSLNFGTTYSDWEDYPSGSNPVSSLAPKLWSGTLLQEWNGEHVILQYWSRLAGSSDHVQSADAELGSLQRHFPHVFVEGIFNQHGFDGGVANQMQMKTNYMWTFDFFYEWPAQVSLNVWGVNPDGQPDQTRVYGDIDGDYILDRIPPYSLINNVINITDPPPSPFLGWQIALNDADYRFQLIPIGSRWYQLILFVLLWTVPILTGITATWAFVQSFYSVKLNEVGTTSKKSLEQRITHRPLKRAQAHSENKPDDKPQRPSPEPSDIGVSHEFRRARQSSVIANPQNAAPKRLTVLIATMEYEIEDWGIKVKIGGLGVMSSLMGKHLKHQDLIWVVPW